MLIVALAEGYGLVKWGRARPPFGDIKLYTLQEAVMYECTQMALMVIVILISTYLIKALGETFHGRHNYTQSFTVVAYALTPLFLVRLLDVIPTVSLWIFWGIGIVLTMKVLYTGVPRIMEPDPPHALGLYFMSALLITMVTCAERAISIGYLAGKYQPVSQVLTRITAGILHKLHLGQ